MSGLWLSRQQGLVDLSELRTKSITGNSASHWIAIVRTNICGIYRRCIDSGLTPAKTTSHGASLAVGPQLRAMFDVGYFPPDTLPE
jgi:hypothetical protein